MIAVLGGAALRLFGGGCCEEDVQRDPGCRAEEVPNEADVNVWNMQAWPPFFLHPGIALFSLHLTSCLLCLDG